MKLFFYFLLLFHLLTLNVYGQNIESVKTKLVKDLTPKVAHYSWTLKEFNNKIELSYIDTFFINTSISPLNNRNGFYNKLDTLFIQVRLEDNWSQKKVDSLKSIQKAMLDPMIKKFIAHYDSLKWVGIKSNREMFLYQPVFYLMRWDDMLTQNEKNKLKNLVRLPDKTIGNIGLFIESTLSCYAMLEPREVNIKVDNAYHTFSETLGVSLYICEEIYK
jgi:hypothetical protein